MSAQSRFVFRVDASTEIGAGHVARCLALADSLKSAGATCLFLCRDLPGHMGSSIAAAGHEVGLLPAYGNNIDRDPSGSGESSLAEFPWRQDLADCASRMPERSNWLVVDHYGLDYRWEREARQFCDRLMVIDDLANREHHCDLLLDQNVGRVAEDYFGMVPTRARLLIGPSFALLRPEFPRQRQSSLSRRAKPAVRNILVSFGRADPANVCCRALEALAMVRLPRDSRVTVVVGGLSPWLAQAQTAAAGLGVECAVISDAQDMAELMSSSDLAIGAGGITALERCALGVPSICVSIAANQEPGACAMARAGGHWYIGSGLEPQFGERLSASVAHALADPGALHALSEAAAAICDGQGVSRVLRELVPLSLVVRSARIEDSELVYAWRNHEATRRYFFDDSSIDVVTHRQWIEATISRPDRELLIAEVDGVPVGCVRFDLASQVAEISVYLDPARVGEGLGAPVIRAACQHFLSPRNAHTWRITAKVMPSNTSSLRVFERAGFEPHHVVLHRGNSE